MKVRWGHVSNSSSSSFTIPLSAISSKQLQQILDYHEEAKRVLDCGEYSPDSWTIRMSNHSVFGYTTMCNGDLPDFLEKIGVVMQEVRWGD